MKSQDFKCFVVECGRLQELLGLKNWDISYKFEELEDDHAVTNFHCNGRTAIITLGKKSNDTIENLALHEMLEILLAEVRVLANGTYSYDVVDKAIHEIISRLINVLKDKL